MSWALKGVERSLTMLAESLPVAKHVSYMPSVMLQIQIKVRGCFVVCARMTHLSMLMYRKIENVFDFVLLVGACDFQLPSSLLPPIRKAKKS